MEKHDLYIFNPDCELAIANGGRFYMPPANIVRMAEDLAFLPAYLGGEEDGVLVSREVPPDFNRELAIPVRPVREEEVAAHPEAWQGVPWGRSPKVCRWMAEHGIGEAWQEAWKDSYSRLTARNVLLQLMDALPFVEEGIVPRVCHSLEEVKQATESGDWLVKAPWSSSGKGQLRLKHPINPKADEWMGGILKRQGYLMLERRLDKVQDFAMEFQIANGTAEFIGWSCFATGEHGEYQGNDLAPQECLEKKLRGLLGAKIIGLLKTHLPAALQTAFPDYAGCLGVDMLVYRGTDGQLKVHPCLEINLRCNMGIVALHLAARYLAPGALGRFLVRFHPHPGEALAAHLRDSARFPAIFHHHRLLSGYLPLTPVNGESCFTAAIYLHDAT